MLNSAQLKKITPSEEDCLSEHYPEGVISGMKPITTTQINEWKEILENKSDYLVHKINPKPTIAEKLPCNYYVITSLPLVVNKFIDEIYT